MNTTFHAAKTRHQGRRTSDTAQVVSGDTPYRRVLSPRSIPITTCKEEHGNMTTAETAQALGFCPSRRTRCAPDRPPVCTTPTANARFGPLSYNSWLHHIITYHCY